MTERDAVSGIAKAWASTPIEQLKAWAAFHIIDNAAPYLSQDFVMAHFGLHNATLSGQAQLGVRWKRAMRFLNEVVGEAVGRLYVEAYFSPRSKMKIESMVASIKEAMSKRINSAAWMMPQTKVTAQRKLQNLRVKIGYPATWLDYSALVLPGNLVEDVVAARRFEWQRRAARLYQPVDKEEWGLPPHYVFAGFGGGEVLFSAGMLQAPYFDSAFDDAVNYGAIGAVIGHEITHAFDDQGRKFDENGALADWWQAGDIAAFNKRTEGLVRQYNAFAPFAGMHINGQLTLGENIADLGGLLIAYDAYHASLGGQAAPVRDGLSGEQRFFLGFAQSWREKVTDQVARRDLLSNPHSPVEYRTNGVVQNVDAWYDAFGVRPGAKLYVAPSARVRIW